MTSPLAAADDVPAVWRQRVARAIYSALWVLILPLALARVAWRARREPGYGVRLGERCAVYGADVTAPAGGGPRVWLHTVSLGETRAAQPLIEALRARWPDMRLILTHTTATGRQAGAGLLRAGDVQLWLPYDLVCMTRRFLRRLRPDIGVLMETEAWPNLGAACAAAGVPLLLANARMSARSAARWQRWPALSGATFGALRGAAAQTEPDAQRLRALGVREVEVAGNLKFDRASQSELRALGAQWRAAAGRPVLLLASTRDAQGVSEEQLLLDAMPAGVFERALVVVVPRHPHRAEAVWEMLRARGRAVARRSRGLPSGRTALWLGDSLGEMPAYYAMADAAFIGASLLPLGGQNLIEACAESCPVVLGPHVFNFTQAAAQAVGAGAAVQVSDAAGVWQALLGWLDDPDALRTARAAAQGFSAAHRGAALKQAQWIADRLPPAGQRPLRQ